MVMQTIEYDELSMEKGRWRSEECPLTKNTLLEMSFSPKTLVRFSLFLYFYVLKVNLHCCANSYYRSV